MKEKVTKTRNKNQLLSRLCGPTEYVLSERLFAVKLFWTLIFCGISLSLLEGCDINVGGQQRPLIRHGRIQGELELSAELRTDEQGTAGNKRESKTNVFEERIRLKTEGDVYHPDLLFFTTAVGFGLAQQHIDSDEETDEGTESLSDYDLFAQVLRAKSFPTTFYANKSEDLIPRHFLGSLRTERENRGASLSLKSKEWPMMLQYTTSRTDQEDVAVPARDFFERDDERFRYSVNHNFGNLSHISFDFDRTDVSQRSVGALIKTETDRCTLLHDFIFGKEEQYRLDSFANYVDQSGSFNFENMQLEERLKLQHSENFLTIYNLRFTDSKRDIYNNRETRGRIGFEHKLYESLQTTAYAFASKTDFDTQGDLTQKGGVLAFNYRKNNPFGILLSSYTAGLTNSKQSGGSGTGVVIDEPHVATELTPVELDRVNIIVSSIIVKNTLGLPFQEGEDYTITEYNGRVWLNIMTVGGIIPPNFVEGQDFLVDYQFLVEPERKEETLRQNFTLRERFKNGLSLYYAYRQQDETVSSNVTEITPDEYNINTVGADFSNKGLFLQAEYSKEDSTQIPSTSRKMQARYSWLLNTHTNISIRALNQWLDFEEPDKRDVVLLKAGTEMFSRLTNELSFSVRADYRNEDDSRIGKTEGFQFDSEIQYRYRQLYVITGIEFSFLDRRNDEIDSSFLYLRIKRLF